MIRKFSAILDDDIINNSKVLFILGDKQIFNKYITDKFKASAASYIEDEEGNTQQFVNSVGFNEFVEVKDVISPLGDWYCRMEWDEKQKQNVTNIIRKIPDRCKLIIECNNWKQYRGIESIRGIKDSNKVNIIELEYPNKESLIKFVIKRLNEKGTECSVSGAELFVQKLSDRYDMYEECMDRICRKSNKVKENDIREILDDIQFFSLEDLLNQILKGSKGSTVKTKVNKMIINVLESKSTNEIITYIIGEANKAIEIHELIYKGIIPVEIIHGKYNKYSTRSVLTKEDINKRISESSKVYKMSDWALRKNVSKACRTSMYDWMIIREALRECKLKSEDEKKLVLWKLCNRKALGVIGE